MVTIEDGDGKPIRLWRASAEDVEVGALLQLLNVAKMPSVLSVKGS